MILLTLIAIVFAAIFFGLGYAVRAVQCRPEQVWRDN